MSKRKTCQITGKICYSTAAEAHLALDTIMKRRKNKYILNKVYKCNDCYQYHLTKQEK